MNLNLILRESEKFLGPTKLVSKNDFKIDYEKFNDRKINEVLDKVCFDRKKDRIAFLSIYDKNYTRTEYLRDLFKRNRINIDYFIFPKNYFKLLWNLIKFRNKYNYFFVSFRGHEIMPSIRMIVGKNKTIIFDAFVSVYDTLCFDRKLFNPSSILGKFLKWYDKWLGHLSDIVLVDTNAHAKYFKKELNLKNVDYLYVGCNKNLFKKIKVEKNKNKFVIFWYGYANPLQGVDIILKAAKLLEKRKDIKFKLVGPIRDNYNSLIKKLNLKNIELIDYIPYERLPKEINKSDICLGGHFSNIEKAKRVIPGKIFQFLSCKKLTIIGNNSANREIFKESNLTKFVKMNDPEALANKILEVLK